MPVGSDDQVSLQSLAIRQSRFRPIRQKSHRAAARAEADGAWMQPGGQLLENLTPRNCDGIDTEGAVETGGVYPSDTRTL